MKKEKTTCIDCGNAPVNHTVEKIDSILDHVLSPLNHLSGPVIYFIEPLINTITNHTLPILFRFLTLVHLGIIVKHPDNKLGGRAKCIWVEAEKMGINMWEFRLFGLAREAFVASYNGKTIVFNSLPRPGSHTPISHSWIDNKGIMRRKFTKAGIPVAHGGTCYTFAGALKIFKTLDKPVIVKPVVGSRSRHTTTHISTEAELKMAYKKAKQLCIEVVVEEELKGMVFRGTVIGGKVIGIMRREPACVIGDGIHNVRELIEIENKRPERSGPIFHKIDIHDHEHKVELERVGMTFSSIPEKDQFVVLSQKASRGLGGGTTDLTDVAHPEVIATLEKVSSVLKESLVGIDFIIDDVTKPFSENPHSGIIECNSMPFIDLHLFPLVGEVRNTPGALWHIVFGKN